MLTFDGRIVAGIALVAIVAGVALDYRELVILAIGLGLTLVVGAVVLWRRPTLRIRREVRPARVAEGEPATATVTVGNDGRRRTAPLVASERFGDEDIAIGLPVLRPGVERATAYVLATHRRGRYPVGPLTVQTTDPLRLLQIVHARGGESTLIVHPRLYRASPLPTGRIREIDEAPGARSQQGGPAFHSLRDYVPGDPPRRIDWKSTARTGKLLVRHHVVSTQPNLVVVLDTHAGSYRGDDHFDDAVRVAASLVVAGVDASHPTEFATTGGVVATADLTGGRTALLDLLAGVTASDDDAGLAGLLRLAHGRRGAALGVVTGHPSPEHASAIARVLSRFVAVTVVQMGGDGERPALSISGARVLSCNSPEHFEHVWKTRVG